MGMRIHAMDRDVGHAHDVYFDDVDWRVRYLHVDTQHWLPGRHVLLAPTAVQSVDWERGRIQVAITGRKSFASNINKIRMVVRTGFQPVFESRSRFR